MSDLPKSKKAISKLVFSVTILILLVAFLIIGFFGYSSITSLQSENKTLQSNVDSLQTNVENLQSSNDQLQSNYQESQSLYNQLKSSNDQLKSSYDQLKSSDDQLKSAFNQLQSSYSQLNSQYSDALSKIPSTQGIKIDSVYYQRYYQTPSGVYNVTVRNLLSSPLQVTALKLYYGNSLLASSAAVSVTIPANSAITIEKFLPWQLTADLHVLKVETLEGYTASSDPLSRG
jgi:uncharacterized phage infection (PIP) family protein YhgE